MADKLEIGLLGLGTVGAGVPKLLKENKEKIMQVTGKDITVKRALVKDLEEKSSLAGKFDLALTVDYDEILDDEDIQLVVELIGGIEPAKTFIMQAFDKGKHVVTANKDLIAQYGVELVNYAKSKGCDFYFEASVAGGIPILRTLSTSLVADDIEEIYGIVNGTTNYMMTKMLQEKWSYEEALAEAQRLGFAESDPTNDVDGIDAAYKMIILTQFAFGMSININHVEKKGIRGITKEDIQVADQLGYIIKLLGQTKSLDNSVSVEVGPVLVPKSHPLATVNNEMNAVFVKSYGVGESMYYGPGAGEKPTATSVVSDIMAIAKDLQVSTTGYAFNSFKQPTAFTPEENNLGKYYFAVEVPDIQGMFLEVAREMTECGVSFDQIIQHSSNGEIARIVVITHEISTAQKKAIENVFAKTENIQLKSVYRVL